MPDYSKTVIYKIVHCENIELIYIGSTTNFTKRKNQHKRTCGNTSYKGHNYKVYQMIRENGGWDLFKMVQICEYPCDNKREAEKEEDKYMLEYKSNMNHNRACRTTLEYRLENIESKKNYDLIYQELNKEKISKKHKEYREINKDTISSNAKIWREANKEHLLGKTNCECGIKNISTQHIKRHRKTELHQKCLNYLENDTKNYRCVCGCVLTILKKKRHELECIHHINYMESITTKKS
jgi:hypothetical protein